MSKQALIDEITALCKPINHEAYYDEGHEDAACKALEIINKHMENKEIITMSPPPHEPMPQTQEHFEARALRDQEMILEQKDEISKLKQSINKLRQSAKEQQ